MTVCTPFNGTKLKKRDLYSKRDLFDEIRGFEIYASTFYDPDRDMLLTFFDEKNRNWENIYIDDNNELWFRLRNISNSGKLPVYELQKKRHVFLRRKKQKSKKYEYLGVSVGETSKTENRNVYRVFRIS